ncbi:MAG: metal ABC transporter permease [Parachlamydiales bacterium]|nr:metal ABC transporter permease [Parachlamydiales bacterium]
MIEIMQQPFLLRALLGSVLACIACGIIGPFVVARRIGYISGGIAHAVLGGMGIAYFMQKSPLVGALAAALISALIIGYVSIKSKQNEDVIISALWASGMALGILFISKTPGYSTDLMSYLFGNVLLIASKHIYFIALLDGIILMVVFTFYKQFVAVCFDEEFAYMRGVFSSGYYMLLLCIVALTVVTLIQIVGLILVIALLILPAAIGFLAFRSLYKIIMSAIFLGVVFSFFGLFISYEYNLPTGPSIILLTALSFILSLVLKRVGQKITS